LDGQIPDIVVLDLEIVIDVVRADRARGSKNIFGIVEGNSGRRAVRHRLGKIEGQVQRGVLNDAVCRLIRVDSKPGADNGLVVRQSPGQSDARSKPQWARLKQGVIPSGLR